MTGRIEDCLPNKGETGLLVVLKDGSIHIGMTYNKDFTVKTYDILGRFREEHARPFYYSDEYEDNYGFGFDVDEIESWAYVNDIREMLNDWDN